MKTTTFTRLTTVLLALALTVPAHAGHMEVQYIHTDHLGTPIAVTDQNGNVIERYEYEPYGLQTSGPVKDAPGYTGHVEDATTGLTYMQQRYYDPQIGMFLSVDPVTAYDQPVGQFNRYWYANGNPYLNIDPDGRADVYYYKPGSHQGGNSSFGHIAVMTKNGTYVSKNPANEGKPIDKSSYHSLEEDQSFYGEADKKIHVDLPDEAAADDFAGSLVGQEGKSNYNGGFENCADDVINTLEAGGKNLGGDGGIDTPNTVVDTLDPTEKNQRVSEANQFIK